MATNADAQVQDLTADPLLASVIQTVGGQRRPVVGGVPLLAVIGEGTTGKVYRGTHPELHREVAVKVLGNEDSASSRFPDLLNHANAAAAVKSPRLVELLRVGEEMGLVFFVMECLTAKSADACVKAARARLKPGMDEVPAVDACTAAAEGLAAAHADGVVHLDIRPSSILIPTGPGDVLICNDAKLSDLGQAYNAFAGRLLAGTPAVTGTPGFMSPEQAGGTAMPSPASDVFSLGATLYALLAGQSPFDGPSLDAILSMTATLDAPNLRTWRPDVSRATAKIAEICLRKNPAARFRDAGVLHQAFLIAREARGGPVDAQTAAVEEIEGLAQKVGAAQSQPVPPAPVLETTRILSAFSTATPAADTAEPAAAEPPLEATMIAGSVQIPPQAPVAPYEVVSEQTLISSPPPPAPASVVDHELTAEPPQATPGWVDPTLLYQEEPPPPKRRAPVLLAAAGLLVVCGVGAWQLGWLNALLKPKPKPVGEVAVRTQVIPSPDEEKKQPSAADVKLAEERLAAEAQAKAAKEKEDADRRAADEAKAKADLARVTMEVQAKAAKEKEDAERRAAEEAKAKAAKENEDADHRVAEDAKAKAEQERVAAETRAKAAKEKEEADRAAEAAKAKSEQERVAAETRAKAAKEKEEADRAAEAAKAKAEQERVAAETRAKAVKENEDADRRTAEEAKAKAEQARPAPVELGKEAALELAPGVKMDFALVPAGRFTMGMDRKAIAKLAKKTEADEQEYGDETPARKMAVSAFYIAKMPVTVGQFRAFATATGYRTAAERAGAAYTLRGKSWRRTAGASWQNPGFPQEDSQPVVLVSFRDCEAFAAWAAKMTGLPLRLPTEAEWEYAARGSDEDRVYPWGDTWDGLRANHCDERLQQAGLADWKYSKADDGFAFTSPVGAFANASWCGAVDMAGNVLQWCSDVYEPYSQFTSAPQIISDGAAPPADAPRVLRGGSYLSGPMNCRTTVRRSSPPRSASCEFGMRLSFTPPAK